MIHGSFLISYYAFSVLLFGLVVVSILLGGSVMVSESKTSSRLSPVSLVDGQLFRTSTYFSFSQTYSPPWTLERHNFDDIGSRIWVRRT